MEAIAAGDAIMVKGSHGSQLAPLVEALKRLDQMSGFKGVISAAWRIVSGANSVPGDAARN
jgi:hypothetical protein